MFRNYDIMCQCVEGRVFERMVVCSIYVYHLLPATPCSDTQDASNDDIGA